MNDREPAWALYSARRRWRWLLIFNLDEAKRIEEENEVEQETSTSTNTKRTPRGHQTPLVV